MSLGTAFVTGAASGIGLKCARSLLGAGVRVAVADREGDALEQAFGDDAGEALPIVVDLADPSAGRAAVARAVGAFGGIDALLHFAAVWSGVSWEQSTPEEWERVLRVNVTGAFFLVQAVAKHMTERRSGRIVLIGSDSAKVGGVAGGPAYVASKGGIIALTRSLARALGPYGVTVNAINPGVVNTPMTSAWPSDIKAEAIRRTPLGRLAEPGDIADVACFLASDQAKFITGEVVEVNGGFYFD